ncbi:MAG: ribonuclease P protein component [bacterium]
MGDFKFSKQQRIYRNAEYQTILKTGMKSGDRFFRVAISRNPRQSNPKLGIIVSKKVGIAVIRNRIKRMVREIFRLNQNTITAEANIVVIAKPDCVTLPYQDIEKSLLTLIDRVDGIKKDIVANR